MSFKRTRMSESSTLFPSDVSLPVVHSENVAEAEQSSNREEELIKQPYNPKKVVKQFNAETIDKARRPGIFTMPTADPVHDAINVGGEHTGGQSDICFYCKKKFRPSMDLFMYRGLAFCKAECRDSQMNHDKAISERYAILKSQLAQERASGK